MHITKARKLKVGDRVSCPADRGDPAFTGQVSWVQADAKAAIAHGSSAEYIWVEVQGQSKKSVWPSNRLG